jgi:hypothetical protein
MIVIGLKNFLCELGFRTVNCLVNVDPLHKCFIKYRYKRTGMVLSEGQLKVCPNFYGECWCSNSKEF